MSTLRSHLLAITGNRPPDIEQLWALAKFQLNPQQKAAILHEEGPLYLTAGPGSGKTRVLLWRTLHLIVHRGVPPEEIFLSTFTEKAALQLTEGLRVLLGHVTNFTGQPYDLSGMYIGTVHSLCQRMLTDRRRFFADRHRQRAPVLLDELGQYFHLYQNRMWQEIVSRAGLDPESANTVINAVFEKNFDSQSKHRAIESLRAVFNRFSEELIEPDEARRRVPALDWGGDFTHDEIDLLLRLYEAYLASLADPARTDFSLLQKEAYKVLTENPDSGKVFQHVIVDEYQDTNYIQERIFFRLAAGTGNLCVVGDDDQALYRFRGATVENFVQFPERCKSYLDCLPTRISLDTNYRSRCEIVDFYGRFMQGVNWRRADGQGAYRVLDKNIRAHSNDNRPAVVASTPGKGDDVCAEIAGFVRQLIDDHKVENANQIAFLFPSLKSKQVGRMKAALEAEGLNVYAPRAGRFLEVDEARDVFGVMLHLFGHPKLEGYGGDLKEFNEWLDAIHIQGSALIGADPRLKAYVADRRAEIKRASEDYQALLQVVTRNRWETSEPYRPERMKRALVDAPGLSETGRKLVASAYLDRIVQRRMEEGQPLSLEYIVRRSTSLDWNVLDLFYQLMGFEHFKRMFDQAERNGDEGPVANLGMITQYVQRFIDERVSIITANLLSEQKFSAILFGSYLFALFRLGETELEDADDPFPRGRIPFLTIHQSKGLEFPVVVLGNLDKRDHGAPLNERIVRPLLTRPSSEPLHRMNEFDIMRMFYVALSRAKTLLVLAHFKGQGLRMFPSFNALMDGGMPRLPAFDVRSLPDPRSEIGTELPHVYSFTADYLLYQKCPRQYMIFRKFGFVPSRSQTMFFGSLVHNTLEDLHHELIRRRAVADGDGGSNG